MSGIPIPIKKLKDTVKSKPLDCPTYIEVAEAIKKGLAANYDEAGVEVVQCPNLTDPPINLASRGISGQPRLLDIGGVPYLLPLPTFEKMYDLKDLPELTDMDLEGGKQALIIGAGAGPWPLIDRASEMVPNVTIDENGEVVKQNSVMARNFDDKSYKLVFPSKEETRLSFLGNLFLSEGKQGTVLEIRCKKRNGDLNFVTCIRKSLIQAFPGKAVGLGGVFTAKKGKLKIHIMPGFSKKPIKTDDEVADWLDFYEMDSEFTCLSFMLSKDPGLDVRLEHSHGYNLSKGQGGHYHTDTTPDIVEYVGYYTIAEHVYRVDQPTETHMVGRD